MPKEVMCPECYEFNHYNATKCQHCLSPTYQANQPEGGSWFWSAVVIILFIVLFF